MIKKIYDKCVSWAGHRYAKPILAFEAFIESSFFPIPPDVMIVPMVIAKKKNYIKIFLIASFFSVLGGVFGYLLGSIFYDLSFSVIEFYGYENKVEKLKYNLIQISGRMAELVDAHDSKSCFARSESSILSSPTKKYGNKQTK